MLDFRMIVRHRLEYVNETPVRGCLCRELQPYMILEVSHTVLYCIDARGLQGAHLYYCTNAHGPSPKTVMVVQAPCR